MNNPNISRLVLLKTSLENDYKHTIWFGDPEGDNTKTNQTNYFLSKKVKNFDFANLTYIRKDSSVKIPAHYDDVIGANYVMYQNSNETKWYYAFITDIRYINESVTELILETDVIQTWMFAYKVQPSFIEREHVSDDTIGANTYPELVETGEYINQYTEVEEMQKLNFADETYIVVAVSENGMDLTVPNGARVYNGVFSGFYYLVFATASECESYIRRIQNNTADVIYSIFLMPKDLFKVPSDHEGDVWFKPSGSNFNMAYLPYNESAVLLKTVNISDLKYLDGGYVPRNNKLLCYPYRYMLMSNNAGSVKEYKYELFDGNPSFKIEGAVSPGCEIKLTPKYYNYGKSEIDYSTDDFIESLDGPKLPTCSWWNDSYTNWLTQNAVNIPLGIIGGIGSGATSGAITGATVGGPYGAIAGGVVGGLSGITGTVAQVYEKSLAPITAKGGVNQGNLVFAKGLGYSLYKRSIKEEYAKIIDNYFDMFGYKVCRVKEPNTNHRAKYWYTKTIDANIDGGVPGKDLQKIKEAYNNGITFWRYEGSIGIYKDTTDYNKISKNYA